MCEIYLKYLFFCLISLQIKSCNWQWMSQFRSYIEKGLTNEENKNNENRNLVPLLDGIQTPQARWMYFVFMPFLIKNGFRIFSSTCYIGVFSEGKSL